MDDRCAWTMDDRFARTMGTEDSEQWSVVRDQKTEADTLNE